MKHKPFIFEPFEKSIEVAKERCEPRVIYVGYGDFMAFVKFKREIGLIAHGKMWFLAGKLNYYGVAIHHLPCMDMAAIPPFADQDNEVTVIYWVAQKPVQGGKTA